MYDLKYESGNEEMKAKISEKMLSEIKYLEGNMLTTMVGPGMYLFC